MSTESGAPPSAARTEWRVAVGDAETTAIYESPSHSGDSGVLFVAAHGAGGNMEDRGMRSVASTLRERGIGVVRFNFLYSERKSGRPDPMPKLQACVAAVVARAREELRPRTLIIGGRSMGGRAASMLCAEGFACDGLLLLAYPLHPAGRPEKLRDAHLPAIRVPVLCFSGTRDDLCTRELMEQSLETVQTTWDMHWLEGADHSFHVLNSSGWTDAQVMAEVGDATQSWVAGLH
jgi:predicted alpha/beta-hydrolase family hydrolase